jgi:L-threonylcarbamoyladenylate synthase
VERTVADAIELAAAALREGRLVVLPTDTVYGIGAMPAAPEAIAAMYSAKGRPLAKPIPVLAAAPGHLAGVVVVDDRVAALGERFWPGPLTLVLERAPGFTADLGGAGARGVAVRVPGHDLALMLLERAGPLAVSSANSSGEAPATTVEAARDALGDRVAVYLDGGRCDGRPSTVLSLIGPPRVLRPGPVTWEEIEPLLG